MEAEGPPVNHNKPHGTLFFAMRDSPEIADAIVRAVKTFGVPLFGLKGTNHELKAKEYDVPFIPVRIDRTRAKWSNSTLTRRTAS